MNDNKEEIRPKLMDSISKRSLSIVSYKYKGFLNNNVKHDSFFDTKAFAKSDQPLLNGFLTTDMILKKTNVSLRIQLPYPINNPKCYTIDYYTELLNKKLEYIKEITYYAKLQKKKKLTAYSIEYKGQIPNYIMNLINGKTKDPDKYLKTNHNFYYTGGILDKCFNNDNLCLIYASEGNNLNLTSVGNTDLDLCYQLDSPIYNVNVYQNGSRICALVRHKHKLRLYEIHFDHTEAHMLEEWHSQSEKVPFVDFKLNKYNDSILVELKANNKLSICNWESLKNVEVDLECDCFQFDYLNENTLFMISPKETLIYDIRTCNEESRLEYDGGILACDYLSTFTTSNNRNYLYTLSTHYIGKFDLRMLRFVQKTSHLLQNTPVICKNFLYDNRQIICASSSQYDDRILYADGSIPQRIPNIFETYQKMNLHFQPKIMNKLEDHLKLSTTGVCLVPNNRGFKVYTCNSIGEIFCDNVNNDQLDDDASYAMLYNWIENIPKTKEPLQVTDIKPMTFVKNVLCKPIDEGHIEKYICENQKLNKFYQLDVPDNNLNLKSIWEDDEKIDEEEIDAGDKVMSWLQKSEMQ